MNATRCLLVLLLCCTVSAAQIIDQSSPETRSSSELVGAASATFSNFVRGVESRPGQDALIEIPSKYWAESIVKLKPVKVYTHKVNVAVVFRIHDNMEEGKYILIPISSYLPQNGVDGFEFTPNPQKGGLFFSGGNVFDFKRKTGS